ncbi:unnamed protein product [Tilletia controversa]|nr:unnamed protein product [Tilletia controversa]CAD6966983.1 unnamed protein product [Tilletia controversa]
MSTQRKKIVLALDGTWYSRSEAVIKGVRIATGIEYHSNIALMAQALKPHDQDGVPQVVYYQPGVGTTVGLVANVIAGATGNGLLDNMIAAYGFLVDNYAEGDDIYLFGFSRGAYTARALSGFISYAGIIKKSQMGFLNPIIAAYTRRSSRHPGSVRLSAEVFHKYTGLWPGLEAIEREKDFVLRSTSFPRPEDELRNHWTIPSDQGRVHPPPIKVIGVFDTVGSLGIPGAFDLPIVRQQFEFFDTALSGNVQCAYQALALNENRADFRPTLWTVRADDKQPHQVVKQCWFKGSHPDVGGGFYEHGLSDVTLAWMVAQMMDHPDGPQLLFNLNFIKQTQDRTRMWGSQPAHPTRLPFMFRYERQVLATPPPEERSERESAVAQPAKLTSSGRYDDDVDGVRLQTFEPTSESLHYSVTLGHDVRPETSEEFHSLRMRNPAKLRKMWQQAQNEETLLPTERELLWTETQAKLQPLSVAYGALYGLVSPAMSTRFQALVELFGGLYTIAMILLSYVTYVPARFLSLLFSASLSTENLVGVPPKDPQGELIRAWGIVLMAAQGIQSPTTRAVDLSVEPILLAQK